jgi:hypothetical protein
VRAGPSFVEALVLTAAGLRQAFRADSVDPSSGAAQDTVKHHMLRRRRFAKLRDTMKRTKSNRKVLDMMESVRAESSVFSIHPDSAFHLYWSSLLLATMVYLVLVTPLRVLWQCGRRPDADTRCSLADVRAWSLDLAVDYLIDALWVLDLFLNLCCFAFHDTQGSTNTVTTAVAAISHRYLRTSRALVDIVASLPLDLLGLSTGRYSLYRFVKLLRVHSVGAVLSSLADQLERHCQIRVANSQVNILANGFYAVAMFHVISVAWAIVHHRGSSSTRPVYFDALYWVATTFTTVGCVVASPPLPRVA